VTNDSTKTELSHQMKFKTVVADWIFPPMSDRSCIDFFVNTDSPEEAAGTAMSIGTLSDHCDRRESADEKKRIVLNLRTIGDLPKQLRFTQ
jgi:hypothetical protein